MSKRVQFSPLSQLMFYKGYGESEIDEVFYSKKDYQRMRTATKQSVQEARAITSLSSTSDRNSISDLDDPNFTAMGIEHLIDKDIFKQIILNKRNCYRAVFQEQIRQDLTGKYDLDRLAHVSQRQTEWSTKRAQTMGSCQSDKKRS